MAQVVVLIFVDLRLREDSHLNHVFLQMSGSTTTYYGGPKRRSQIRA